VLFQQCVHLLYLTDLPRDADKIDFRYQGFQTTQIAASPTPNAAGQKVKMAQVLFDTPELASTAKEALDGFTLKKGWIMSVAYI
jgi:U2 small nuclear ribonucleoprotein B''